MSSSILKIILVTVVSFVLTSAYSQHGNKELVLVNLCIVGKGNPAACRNIDTSEYYLVSINILNTQDSTIKFWIMDDCWPLETFFIRNDSITFRSCFSGCEHSVPNEIIVHPKKAAQFYATINSYKKDFSIPLIKVGFRYFTSVNDLWNFGVEKRKKNTIKIFWSNEVELKDNLYSYEVK